MKERKEEHLFLTGMLLSMFCWGLSWASGKVLSAYGATTSVAALRLLITFVALFFLLLVLRQKVTLKKKGIVPLLMASVLMTAYNYLFFEGLLHGKAGAGGVLVTTLNPIISYGIMLLMTFRKPTRYEAIGLFVGALAGVVLLRVWDNWNNLLAAGNLYFVSATVVWALLSLFTARSSRYGSPMAYSLWMYACCSLLMLFFTSYSANSSLWNNSDGLFWFNMLFSAVITTAFATTFYFVATSKIGASKASSFIFLVPFSAAMGSWIFLKEVPQWHTIAGGVLGILAVYILNKKEQKEA